MDFSFKFKQKFTQARSQFCKSTGSVVFIFAVVLLPLLLGFFAISIDLSKVYFERGHLQAAADAAALNAANSLPFSYKALEVAKQTIEQNGFKEDDFQYDVTQDSVRVSTDNYQVRSFAGFSGLVNQFFDLSVTARARLTPRDIDIFMDNSSYLAPPILKSPDSLAQSSLYAWGGDMWPASDFSKKFRLKYLRPANDNLNPKVAAKQFTVSAKISTQQCFNPSFSALKEATYRLYNYFAGIPSFSVGLLMGPSGVSNENIAVVHQLRRGGQIDSQTAEGYFNYYRSKFTSDEYCLALADSQTLATNSGFNQALSLAGSTKTVKAEHGGYGFPALAKDGAMHLPINVALASGRPASLTTYNTSTKKWVLDPQNLHFLTVREIIWSRAVQAKFVINSSNGLLEQQDRIVNIAEVLDYVRRRLVGSAYRDERMALASKTTYTGIVLLGDLPWYNGKRFQKDNEVQQAISTQLTRIHRSASRNKKKVDLYFVYFRHQGNYPNSNPGNTRVPGNECSVSTDMSVFDNDDPVVCPPFFEQGQEFDDFLATKSTSWLTVNSIRIPDRGSLAQEFAAFVPLIGKSVVLEH